MLYEYLNKNEWEKILELDRMLTVQTIAKETRNGSKLIASRMIKLFLDLYDSDILKEYEEKMCDNAVNHNNDRIFSWLWKQQRRKR